MTPGTMFINPRNNHLDHSRVVFRADLVNIKFRQLAGKAPKSITGVFSGFQHEASSDLDL